jgi:hypothetical protein
MKIKIKHIRHRVFLIVLGLLLTVLGILIFPMAFNYLFPISTSTISSIVWLGVTLIGGPSLIFIGIRGNASSINKVIKMIYNKK